MPAAQSTLTKGPDVGYANFVNGTNWPARSSIIYFDEFDSNLINSGFDDFNHNVGDLESFQYSYGPGMTAAITGAEFNGAVFRRIDAIGVTFSDKHEKQGLGRLLWILERTSENAPALGMDSTASSAIFYYAEKRNRTLRKDFIGFHQYTKYKAMTQQEYRVYTGGGGLPTTGISAQLPYGPIGPHAISPSFLGSNANHLGPSTFQESPENWEASRAAAGARQATAVISTPEAAQAIRPFLATSGDGIRWQGKYSRHRDLMKGIEGGVINTHANVGTHGSPGIGSNVDVLVRDALIEAGYTESQITWYRNGGVTNPHFPTGPATQVIRPDVSHTAKGEGSGSKSPPATITAPTPAVSKLIVRAPIGYTKPAEKAGEKPYIQQVGTYLEEPHKYYFKNVPNTVSYQGLGSRWVEIPRKGDFPIVEWSDWALMKVSFDFLIAHNNLDGQPGQGDGLYKDVSWDIDQLRQMAQRPLPVSIFGMDQLFAIQMKRAQTTGRAMQFVIANFTVKSARRVVGEGDKQIAAAQCSMTLQEIPIEQMRVVEMSMPPMTGPAVPGEPGNTASSPGLPSALVEMPHGPGDNLHSGPYPDTDIGVDSY